MVALYEVWTWFCWVWRALPGLSSPPKQVPKAGSQVEEEEDPYAGWRLCPQGLDAPLLDL